MIYCVFLDTVSYGKSLFTVDEPSDPGKDSSLSTGLGAFDVGLFLLFGVILVVNCGGNDFLLWIMEPAYECKCLIRTDHFLRYLIYSVLGR